MFPSGPGWSGGVGLTQYTSGLLLFTGTNFSGF